MWAESPSASNQGANKEEDERGEGNLCVSTYNNQALIECGGGLGGVRGGGGGVRSNQVHSLEESGVIAARKLKYMSCDIVR